MKKSQREDIFKKMSEEMDNITAEEIIDKHLQKEENQNVAKTLRGKVREKLKISKINKGEKSSTEQLIDSEIHQRSKTEVSLDESLSFFILSGEEGSALGKSSEQRPVNRSYPKCFSLGVNLQNVAESEEEEFMKEFILTDILKVKAADYEDDQEQIKKQKANIFVPSSSPVVNQRKLPKDMMPRILEDEGFYIQRKPEIYKKTCNKMENRLLKLEEGKCWFGESGEIMSLPTPIKQSWNFRLNVRKEPLNPLLKTIYRKAVKYDLGSSFMNKMEGSREIYQLDLNIVGLQFSHHHLFNQEQVLCARLLQLYECFQDRQQQNVSQLLYEKLKALTDATKLSNENSEINQLTRKSLQDYYWQISNTKQMYDLERGKDLSLLHSILRTWKQIKSLRHGQGFTSTPIKLQVQRIKMNKCDEQEQISEMSETEKKNEGKELKNGKKLESLSYLASDETEIERIKPITLRPQLSFTAELTSLSKCSFMLRNVDARSVPGIPWLMNEQKLFEWANEVRIDPNNPEYSDLMESVTYMRLKGQDIPKYFRLEQLQDEFNFVSEEEMAKSKRFQLLQLRNAGQLDNFLLQQMPLHDTEIPDLVFQVRRLIMKRIVKISKCNLSDIVNDYEEIVSTSQLTDAVCKFVEPRRKLKPQRKERKKVTAQAISDGDIKILVRIVRAYNIPTRKTTINGSPGHDYSFSSLSKIKDNIYINIFDEMMTEKHEISGTFQVTIPPVLLGYTWSNTYVFPKEDSNEQNLKECTFLNIFATIEPQISYVTCNPTLDKFLDQTEVLQRAQIFKKNCKAMFPNRRIVTTVFNDEGIQFLVTRYIKALNPPQQLLDIFLHNSNATFDLIARFVSLIPFVPNTPDENDGSDIWMTSEHCISLAIGNKEEHAILLCNFFLYFGKKALVLLGTSVLEGHVAYVVTQETNEYLLWNPSTGQCYKQFDPFCPLKSVDCLFDDRNVWFNIQQNNTPMAVFFDYSKESFWKQLLPKNVQGTKIQSIQVTGFPIQMPYIDVQSIIDAVYQTGIHSAEFPQTEFALAVYIHPYPNNILSVWVYLASLVQHQ
ncbi:coiled-coil and C2 domain containing 2B [Homo sapiens]|uniref:Coiled-coil and C2 domain containing 2B n=1 Tax=Homo sapiens TaxID=9606 RepID=A0A5S8K7B6_HUMAN|nr:coiled-coil and C2 domain containing 2B [Homo sapiens]KAI4076945.1 coiled-coil and C2 domain containing 2B [Homo sapiens]